MPCTLLNFVRKGNCCQKKPAWPPTAMINKVDMAMAATATMPIFSSENASERVRGMRGS